MLKNDLCASTMNDVNGRLKTLQEEEIARTVAALSIQGISAERIKNLIHKSYPCIKKILSNHGIECRTKECTRQRNDLILQMHANGIPVKEISEKQSMNRFPVYHILEKT